MGRPKKTMAERRDDPKAWKPSDVDLRRMSQGGYIEPVANPKLGKRQFHWTNPKYMRVAYVVRRLDTGELLTTSQRAKKGGLCLPKLYIRPDNQSLLDVMAREGIDIEYIPVVISVMPGFRSIVDRRELERQMARGTMRFVDRLPYRDDAWDGIEHLDLTPIYDDVESRFAHGYTWDTDVNGENK